MARELCDRVPEAAEIFDLASDVLNQDVRALCWSTTPAKLRLTENAQPALVVSSLACWSAFRARADFAIAPNSIFSGHSLGALAAAASAGYLSIQDAIRLAWQRGNVMATAPGEGSMLAVVVPAEHSSDNQIARAQELAKRFELDVGALNGARQIVLSGDSRRIREAQKLIGASAIELDVSHAFHSELMRPVLDRWSECLEKVVWMQGVFAYVPNSASTATNDPVAVKSDLAEALCAPVYWTSVLDQVMEFMQVVIPGPGKAIERLLRGSKATNVCVVDSSRSLERALVA